MLIWPHKYTHQTDFTAYGGG